MRPSTIDEAIFSGFVTVYSPFEVTVSENGKVLQGRRPPPDHAAGLARTSSAWSNRALGYDVVRQVDVKPGDATNLQLTPDPSPLTVTAIGRRLRSGSTAPALGETPMNATPVPLGVHEIVVKRAAGGERRFNVTIGAQALHAERRFLGSRPGADSLTLASRLDGSRISIDSIRLTRLTTSAPQNAAQNPLT